MNQHLLSCNDYFTVERQNFDRETQNFEKVLEYQ